jgi:uncharacterized membrane protein YhaH (DUF805 family)
MGLRHFLFGLSGRVNRKPYWLFMLGVFLVYIFVMGNVVAAFMAYGLDGEDAGTAGKLTLIVMLTMLVMTWPGIAVLVKRMHDRNRSGWWIAIAYALSIAAAVLSHFAVDGDTGEVLDKALFAVFLPVMIVSSILWLWLIVEVGFLRGTRGTNSFGPDPIGGTL